MRELPIIFSAPMVRAILEGRKTVTRRVVKPQPAAWAQAVELAPYASIGPDGLRHSYGTPGQAIQRTLDDERQHGLCKVPYQVGDRLWVRETWAEVGSLDPGIVTYRATYPHDLPTGMGNVPADIRDAGYRWRPSIHMPRRYSRITLEVTAVRVERLQDITEAQAKAEGAPFELHTFDSVRLGAQANHRAGFERLWESINGAGSWADNPWVWCIEFRRIEKEVPDGGG